MDLIQIKYFLALSKTLNFTRAAELCNVSQPALTKSIQRLEDELGGPMILRERTLTQLTELGRALLPTLQQTYDAAESAHRLAVDFRKKTVAPLRLGVGPDVETSAVLPVIRELDERLPGFEITIQAGTGEDINNWLLRSEIDVAITADGDELTERANRWKIFTDTVVAIVPFGHPLDQPTPIEALALNKHLCIGPVDADTPLGRLHRRFQGNEAGVFAPRHRGTNDQIVRALVLAGLGIGLSTQRRQLPPGLTRRPIEPSVNLDVLVSVIAGRPIPRAADAFLKLMRARSWEPEDA